MHDPTAHSVICDWTSGLALGEIIEVIYTDFSKAFDSVPHMCLLGKLEKYGIQGNILGWIKSFLSCRRQGVGVKGSVSNWDSVTSGIPQSSVLVPVLFVIFINDMPSMTSCICKLFADDAKTHHLVKQPGETGILQQDLNRLVTWSKKWQLPFNTKNVSVVVVYPLP